MFWLDPPAPGHEANWLVLLPVFLVIGCAPFCIRGYTLTPDRLIVHRLWWQTLIPLADLKSAEFVPRAMRWSIRTFGNGGLFSFTGRYWSRQLGSYRAFVTDLQQTVILRFPKRTIVVSPEPAEDFVRELGACSTKTDTTERDRAAVCPAPP
jgi:hypothetical protein